MIRSCDSAARRRKWSRDGGIPAHRELGGAHDRGPVRCLDAPADEFVLNVSAIEIYRQ